ncbi:deazaflavin-dependent oxidoreductase (nitroreductase family) [Mycolicibacterium sp. BK556]|uniref:nitroreductase/quinone reductase family protein n=1 Tax=Mycobacteriaceae TaxID=1762 RepID=UPI0010E2BAEA|nr:MULTISPECIES: nitroreductase/quinone reductase family protein [Mycobacteriaceae]MBB3603796.1 deazaflavin-dependent oxidoreductase (nitroreductase family) [Mycolicibacterium sp. BK556]MBB3633991.1 deazaflavin-dependent oxidoreductase (nitroreductase family) [Mycolicibacterium sp. BK607]TDO12090.1 deazaflavin-dependent oxidoreductase (nitroreductase family) [Mycobacterium sp. BK086]
MLRDAISAFQRWQYRGGRPGFSARISNRVAAIAVAAGLGPDSSATLEVRGRKTGRAISFPVVIADYRGDRYLVAMLGEETNWVRNLRANPRAVLLHNKKREAVTVVEDFTDGRPAILRRYLELAPGARPFFPIGPRAPLTDFEPIVDDYPVFRLA